MFDFPEQITVWNPVGSDGFGGITWSAPVVYPGRIAYRQEKFTDTNGDDRMSSAVAYSEGADLLLQSRVLFGGSADLAPPEEADDVRALVTIPSGSGDIKKVWFA